MGIHKAMLHSSKLQITTVNLTELMLHTGVRCRDIFTSKSRSEEETEPEDNENNAFQLHDVKNQESTLSEQSLCASIKTREDFNDKYRDDVCKNTTNTSEKETEPEENGNESFELHDVENQPVATDLCDSYEESAMSEQSRLLGTRDDAMKDVCEDTTEEV